MTSPIDIMKDFIKWWRDQLFAAIPLNLRKHLIGHRTQLYVRIENSLIHIFNVEADEVTAKTSTNLDDTDLRTTVANMLGRSHEIPSRIVLRLQEDTILRQHLTMPRMSKNDIRASLFLQLDRLSPAPSEDTVFDFYATERRDETNRIDVDVVLCPLHLIESSIQILKNAGLCITDIEIEDMAGIPLPGINLNHKFHTSAPMLTTLDWTLLGTVVVGILASLYLPIYKRSEALNNLQQNLETVRAQALAASQTQEQIARIIAAAEFLRDKRTESLVVVAGLNELSKVIPDNTWLNELHIQNKKVVISGISDAASAVVPAISDSSYFTTPTFTAPVTTHNHTQREQFSLSFDIVGGETQR